MSYSRSQPEASNPPSPPSLELIRDRIREAREVLSYIHAIADRACGTHGIEEPRPGPAAVPNGLLEEIESATYELCDSIAIASRRLSRLA